jgi:hypothetical protein
MIIRSGYPSLHVTDCVIKKTGDETLLATMGAPANAKIQAGWSDGKDHAFGTIICIYCAGIIGETSIGVKDIS